MSETFTSGPWQRKNDYDGRLTIIANVDGESFSDGTTTHSYDFIANCEDEYGEAASPGNVRLILAAPEHALICWAMCVQDGRWEEWTPYDGRGEFVFAGLRYATKVDEFGCPQLTPALRVAIARSQMVGA